MNCITAPNRRGNALPPSEQAVAVAVESEEWKFQLGLRVTSRIITPNVAVPHLVAIVA